MNKEYKLSRARLLALSLWAASRTYEDDIKSGRAWGAYYLRFIHSNGEWIFKTPEEIRNKARIIAKEVRLALENE